MTSSSALFPKYPIYLKSLHLGANVSDIAKNPSVQFMSFACMNSQFYSQKANESIKKYEDDEMTIVLLESLTGCHLQLHYNNYVCQFPT